jgi:diadenosine tetraphosphate (Ap4A) HIT family hydrolase
MTCDLCKANLQGPPSPHEVLWQDDFCRVVLLNDVDYPAYCRVELISHVKEMTDLVPENRTRMMKVVFAVEEAMVEVITPDKINLASLGNKTPHLHWHIIPRFAHDKHFPNSHWGAIVRHEGLKDALQASIHKPSRASILMFKEKVVENINLALANKP